MTQVFNINLVYETCKNVKKIVVIFELNPISMIAPPHCLHVWLLCRLWEWTSTCGVMEELEIYKI
jgi:hypothetical protein